MATVLILLFLICSYNTIFAKFDRIVLFDETTSELNLPTIKTCVSINESLPILNDSTRIIEWIDRSILTTNCSYFLSSSITKSQKYVLTIIQSIIIFILFLPFLFELSLTIIRYYFY